MDGAEGTASVAAVADAGAVAGAARACADCGRGGPCACAELGRDDRAARLASALGLMGREGSLHAHG